MLNKFGPSGHGEAQVQYLDGDFRVISPGTFVRCAITDVRIPLDELKYWSVDLQEAYATPTAVLDCYAVNNDIPSNLFRRSMGHVRVWPTFWSQQIRPKVSQGLSNVAKSRLESLKCGQKSRRSAQMLAKVA